MQTVRVGIDNTNTFNSFTKTQSHTKQTNKQIAAENTRYLADLVGQRETEIAQAEHDASYQQQIAAANETNSVTPDETVLIAAKETAAYDYQTNMIEPTGFQSVGA